MNAVGYIRVSTEGQGKEGVSLDNQRSRTGVVDENMVAPGILAKGICKARYLTEATRK